MTRYTIRLKCSTRGNGFSDARTLPKNHLGDVLPIPQNNLDPGQRNIQFLYSFLTLTGSEQKDL